MTTLVERLVAKVRSKTIERRQTARQQLAKLIESAAAEKPIDMDDDELLDFLETVGVTAEQLGKDIATKKNRLGWGAQAAKRPALESKRADLLAKQAAVIAERDENYRRLQEQVVAYAEQLKTVELDLLAVESAELSLASPANIVDPEIRERESELAAENRQIFEKWKPMSDARDDDVKQLRYWDSQVRSLKDGDGPKNTDTRSKLEAAEKKLSWYRGEVQNANERLAPLEARRREIEIEQRQLAAKKLIP